jgi:hypothetical protein
MAKRGGVIELRDGDTTVCRGDVDDIEAYIATKHPRRRPGGQPRPEYTVPPAWAQIIDDYVLSLAAAGQPVTSLTLRRIQLVRMARDRRHAGGVVRCADRMENRDATQLPRHSAGLLAVGVSHETGSRTSRR